MLFYIRSSLGKGYWDSKYHKTSKLKIQGVVNFTGPVSLKKDLASLRNIHLAPLRVGTDAVILAVTIAEVQLCDTSAVPAAAFPWCCQLSEETVKVAMGSFPPVSLKAEAQERGWGSVFYAHN